MTTTQLIDQIDTYLTPTKPGQYAVVVSRRFLVALKAHLEMMQVLAVTSPQPAVEQEKRPDVQT